MWNGVFRPTLYKHRLYTGNIFNHMYVSSIEVDGNFVTVEMSWGQGGEVYTYEFELEYDKAREVDELVAKELILDYHDIATVTHKH